MDGLKGQISSKSDFKLYQPLGDESLKKVFAVKKLETASLIVYLFVGRPVQDMGSKSNFAAIFSVLPRFHARI